MKKWMSIICLGFVVTGVILGLSLIHISDEFQNFVNTAEKRMQERWNETDSEMDEEEQDADTDE